MGRILCSTLDFDEKTLLLLLSSCNSSEIHCHGVNHKVRMSVSGVQIGDFMLILIKV